MLSFSFKRPRYCSRETHEGGGAISTGSTKPVSETEYPISKTAFFSTSLGVFSVGILYGIRRAMKEEKDPFNIKNNVQGIHMGAKAFLLGTLLCIGTAAGLTAVFVYKSGITDAKQFGEKSRDLVASLGLFPQLDIDDEALKKETEELEKDIETFIATVSTAVGFGPDKPENAEKETK